MTKSDEIKSAVEQLAIAVTKLAERQAEIEKRFSDAIESVRKDMAHLNPVSDNMLPMGNLTNELTVDEFAVDRNGVNWGEKIQKNQRPVKNGSDLQNAILQSLPAIISQSLPLLLQYFMANKQNTLGQTFQEFMIRDFFENYQRGKLYERANMNLLVRKGLLSESDVASVMDNSDTLQDPINNAIKKMRAKNEQPS